jgi:hypothetical protein
LISFHIKKVYFELVKWVLVRVLGKIAIVLILNISGYERGQKWGYQNSKNVNLKNFATQNQLYYLR